MSQYIYNGIQLGLVKTNSIEKRMVMSADDTEYMWTEYLIDIQCVYNPYATSYGTPLLPLPVPGYLAAETEVAIRAILSQPRRPIYFAFANYPVIEVDASNAAGDAFDCN